MLIIAILLMAFFLSASASGSQSHRKPSPKFKPKPEKTFILAASEVDRIFKTNPKQSTKTEPKDRKRHFLYALVGKIILGFLLVFMSAVCVCMLWTEILRRDILVSEEETIISMIMLSLLAFFIAIRYL